MTDLTDALPSLPAPQHRGEQGHDFPPDLFNADQMRAYARTAVAAALTQNAANAESDEVDRLHALVESLTVDAFRYRWLRCGDYPISFAHAVLNDTPHGIDTAIDKARGAAAPAAARKT